MLLFQRTEQGLHLLMDPRPHSETVSMGMFFDVSRQERVPENAGWNHLVEHLLFRGGGREERRTIALAMDALGGEVNAYTEKEELGITLTAPSEYFEKALTVLFGLVTRKNLDSRSLAREKQIIAQEIRMARDDPEDGLWEKSLGSLLKGSLAWPVLGTIASLRNAQAGPLDSFYTHLQAESPKLLSVSGRFGPELLTTAAEESGICSQAWQQRDLPQYTTARGGNWKRRTSQFHLLVILPFERALSENEVLTLQVWAHAFGESNHSRLFQNIREEKGLSYQVYAGFHPLGSSGYFFFYGSTSPSKAARLEAALFREWTQFSTGAHIQEWGSSLASVIAQTRLQSDRLEQRLDRIVGAWLQYASLESPNEIPIKLAALTYTGAVDILGEVSKIEPRIFTLMGKSGG